MEVQEDGSVVKSSGCSFRRPVFGLHSDFGFHGRSQPPVTSVSGHPVPSSGHCGSYMYMVCIHVYRQKAQKTKQIFKKKVESD